MPANEAIEVLKKLANAVEDLIGDSEGVAGFHLNGEVAQWGELDWLTGPLDEAAELIKATGGAENDNQTTASCPGIRDGRMGAD